MAFHSMVLAFCLLFSKPVSTYSQQGTVTSSNQLSPELRARIARDRQLAIEINDLAGRIRSEADADTLVHKIAETFADILPPACITRGIRQRIARAEYEAVSDQSRLIPEQRIADIWNEYVREIGASDEALVLPLLQSSTIYVTPILPRRSFYGCAAQAFGRFQIFTLLARTAN